MCYRFKINYTCLPVYIRIILLLFKVPENDKKKTIYKLQSGRLHICLSYCQNKDVCRL